MLSHVTEEETKSLAGALPVSLKPRSFCLLSPGSDPLVQALSDNDFIQDSTALKWH